MGKLLAVSLLLFSGRVVGLIWSKVLSKNNMNFHGGGNSAPQKVVGETSVFSLFFQERYPRVFKSRMKRNL